jgi:hypothetical protein
MIATGFLVIFSRFDSPEKLHERNKNVLTATVGRFPFCDNMNVPGPCDHRAIHSEKFAHKAFDPVARHGIAHFSTDRNADSSARLFAGLVKDDETTVRKPGSIRRQVDEFSPLEQSVGFGKALPF